jgi:hypothetical protein
VPAPQDFVDEALKTMRSIALSAVPLLEDGFHVLRIPAGPHTRSRIQRTFGQPMCTCNHSRYPSNVTQVKLSVGGTSPKNHLELKGLFTQESRPGRISGESVGGIFPLDCSVRSNELRFDTTASIPYPAVR